MHLDRRTAVSSAIAGTLVAATTTPAAASPISRAVPSTAYALSTWLAQVSRGLATSSGRVLLTRLEVVPTERGERLAGDRFRLHFRSLEGRELDSHLTFRLPGLGRVPLLVTPHGTRALAVIDRRIPEGS